MHAVFERLMVTFNPHVSSMGKQLKKQSHRFHPKTVLLLFIDESLDSCSKNVTV